ncbi:hypothetical protein AB0M39_40795 [Streptomyces sp. NPDC051907]|uniref:hypothetical protein n=1 Tax=Streptomyces sp. NPDC051907 TaxID=3155284 RepID=UPI003445C9A4
MAYRRRSSSSARHCELALTLAMFAIVPASLFELLHAEERQETKPDRGQDVRAQASIRPSGTRRTAGSQ